MINASVEVILNNDDGTPGSLRHVQCLKSD